MAPGTPASVKGRADILPNKPERQIRPFSFSLQVRCYSHGCSTPNDSEQKLTETGTLSLSGQSSKVTLASCFLISFMLPVSCLPCPKSVLKWVEWHAFLLTYHMLANQLPPRKNLGGMEEGTDTVLSSACTSPRSLVTKWLIKGTRGSYHKTNMNQKHSLIT